MTELSTTVGQVDPYPIYAQLRRLGEVVREPNGSLVVTGYRACSALLRENRLRKQPGRTLAVAGYPDWRNRPSLYTLYTSILMLNPPDHTRLRRLVSRAFTVRRVSELRESMVRIADDMFDRIDGTVDFVDTVAFPLPVTVIGELLGVPAADQAMFRGLIQDWTMVLEDLDPLVVGRADTAATAIRDYFSALVAERRARPTGDLISVLASTDSAEEQSFSDEELVTMAALILFAGFETTTGLLGNGLVALLERPAQADRLRREVTLGELAVEELLRYDGPVQSTYGRVAAGNTMVGDIPARAGQRVTVIIAAANRDPEVFDAPGELIIDRDQGAVLSFGGGIHHCLGAPLARLEGEVVLPRLLRRFPRLRLAGPPVRRATGAVRSFKSLPIASQ